MSQDLQFSTVEVARMFDVAPNTVRNWITSGRLAAIDVGSKSRPKLRISESAISDFRTANAVQKV